MIYTIIKSLKDNLITSGRGSQTDEFDVSKAATVLMYKLMALALSMIVKFIAYAVKTYIFQPTTTSGAISNTVSLVISASTTPLVSVITGTVLDGIVSLQLMRKNSKRTVLKRGDMTKRNDPEDTNKKSKMVNSRLAENNSNHRLEETKEPTQATLIIPK